MRDWTREVVLDGRVGAEDDMIMEGNMHCAFVRDDSCDMFSLIYVTGVLEMLLYDDFEDPCDTFVLICVTGADLGKG